MLATGNESRDFIDIQDVLRAITLPLKNDKMWGNCYNVGSGRGIKVKDLLTLMPEELDKTSNISFTGKSWQGDILGISANINKIRRLGFEPAIDLRIGIKKFIKAERANGLLANTIF